MELAKKARKIQRASFTKCLHSFNTRCENENVSEAERIVAWQLLETRMQKLDEANTKYVELLISSDISEVDVEEDIASHEVYQLQFLMAKLSLSDQSKEKKKMDQFYVVKNRLRDPRWKYQSLVEVSAGGYNFGHISEKSTRTLVFLKKISWST